MEQSFSAPVDNNAVPKVDDAVAVGEDLDFQERWWIFERVIWSIFALILVADVLGLFGRGWLAKAEIANANSGMDISYEKVERASTPSIVTVRFDDDAIENGVVRLFVSNSIVKELGAQRVIPQPEHSDISSDGITYTFLAHQGPALVQFQLEPSFPGIHRWSMQIPSRPRVDGRIVVVP